MTYITVGLTLITREIEQSVSILYSMFLFSLSEPNGTNGPEQGGKYYNINLILVSFVSWS